MAFEYTFVDLDGAPFTCDGIAPLLLSLDHRYGDVPNVTAVGVAPGSMKQQPHSQTAILQASVAGEEDVRRLFVKKVSGTSCGDLPPAAVQRALRSVRTELRFYGEFAETLAARSVRLPRVAGVVDCLAALDTLSDDAEMSDLQSLGCLLCLECIDGRSQTSPVSHEQSLQILASAARLHAATWEDAEVLHLAVARLQAHGGSFALASRPRSELASIRVHWARFLEIFGPLAPDLLSRPEVATLGERLEAIAQWVSEQVSVGPSDPCAVLMHGDMKAMNCFLDAAGKGEALFIDFEYSGVGFGMSDVALFMSQSVAPEVLAGGGEDRLLGSYFEALAAARGPAATPYEREAALRHYRLGTIDYFRYILCKFWGDASPEAFAARAGNMNVSLPNRSTEAALVFVERAVTCMDHLERECGVAAVQAELA